MNKFGLILFNKFLINSQQRLISSQFKYQNILGRGIGNLNKIWFDDARLIFTKDAKFNCIELFQKEEVWLRDHCRTSTSYNFETNQRNYPISFDSPNQKLNIHWADGQESSFFVNELLKWGLFSDKQYTEECISDNLEEDLESKKGSSCPSRTLWRGESLKDIPSLSKSKKFFSDLKNINFDFSTFARLFIRFGVVCVTGVEANDRGLATQKLCEKIAPIHSTFFGDFWHFGTDNQQLGMATFDDTAYGNEEIGPHSDGTYFDQPPGIQVFHCLKPSLKGGQTLLIDGFSAAEILKFQSIEHFHVLANFALEHHYVDKDKLHARCVREPVIKLFPRVEKVAQIRYNPYDRAPMKTLLRSEDDENNSKALEETVLFYEAYQRFARIINEPGQKVQIMLKPRNVLFIDNFRILHGRRSFQGERSMCGCYLSRDCFLAKARPLLSPEFYRNLCFVCFFVFYYKYCLDLNNKFYLIKQIQNDIN
ncbi:TauD domain-containing protein [Meloidogyne graminicola]|uniref:Trimethyllysine dioxygenase, mitochondrial n=1 Tax=Meloidogyne graminicola TaxID=189291 RepID=A0A8S9ZTZ7_9BILA|nr:TauD domain-containing protein [Meloidogyne graminicola]